MLLKVSLVKIVLVKLPYSCFGTESIISKCVSYKLYDFWVWASYQEIRIHKYYMGYNKTADNEIWKRGIL